MAGAEVFRSGAGLITLCLRLRAAGPPSDPSCVTFKGPLRRTLPDEKKGSERMRRAVLTFSSRSAGPAP
jgi:hypothetical protein